MTEIRKGQAPASVEWKTARDRLLAAEARQKDPATPSRILLINGSARNDGTCPGEVSKTSCARYTRPLSNCAPGACPSPIDRYARRARSSKIEAAGLHHTNPGVTAHIDIRTRQSNPPIIQAATGLIRDLAAEFVFAFSEPPYSIASQMSDRSAPCPGQPISEAETDNKTD